MIYLNAYAREHFGCGRKKTTKERATMWWEDDEEQEKPAYFQPFTQNPQSPPRVIPSPKNMKNIPPKGEYHIVPSQFLHEGFVFTPTYPPPPRNRFRMCSSNVSRPWGKLPLIGPGNKPEELAPKCTDDFYSQVRFQEWAREGAWRRPYPRWSDDKIVNVDMKEEPRKPRRARKGATDSKSGRKSSKSGTNMNSYDIALADLNSCVRKSPLRAASAPVLTAVQSARLRQESQDTMNSRSRRRAREVAETVSSSTAGEMGCAGPQVLGGGGGSDEDDGVDDENVEDMSAAKILPVRHWQPPTVESLPNSQL